MDGKVFRWMFSTVINNNILSGKNTFHDPKDKKKMTVNNKFKETRCGKKSLWAQYIYNIRDVREFR